MVAAILLFVFGTWLVQNMAQLPSVTWMLCAVVIAALIVLLHHHPRSKRIFSPPRFLQYALQGAAAFMLGICWASGFALCRMSDELPHAWERKDIALVGVVASVPEQTEHGERFRFDVEAILTPDAKVPRHISLSQYRTNFSEKTEQTDSSQFESLHAGERWQLTVRLKQPHATQNPHNFDFEAWAISENIRALGYVKNNMPKKRVQVLVWQPRYLVEHLREAVRQRISDVLAGKPYRGVIQALVMGDDSQISPDDWQVFLRTGTSHLMSISGLHITMLAALAFGIAAFFWRTSPRLIMWLPVRKAATVAGVMTALAYALIAGFAVPTQRTLYMLSVFALALWSGRHWAMSQVLAIALLIVVLFDPWASISAGFWLSFTAVAVLGFVFGGRLGKPHWFWSAVQTQWAVTIGMLPLLLVMFNQASIISPIANALAIPLISFVVTPLALLGSFLPWDAPLLWSYQALKLCMSMLAWLSHSSVAIWQQHAPATWTLFPALAGMLWLLLPRGFPMRWLGLVGFIPVFFVMPERPVSGDIKVTVLDVGQGLSVVVQTAKHNLLYDAGPKFNEQSDAGERIVVPFLRGEGIQKLDGFFVSHNDLDHSGGMASVLAQTPVGWLASSLPPEADIPPTQAKIPCFAGQTWMWDGVQFEVLHPDFASYADTELADNNRSCVLKITSTTGSVLLTGDIEKRDEAGLLTTHADKLESDVMVVPHHGSKTSSTEDFIAAVQPRISVFTAGYLNHFGHPKPVIVERYQAVNSYLYRSDYDGAVTINLVDGRGIDVTGWRNQNRRYWHEVFVSDAGG